MAACEVKEQQIEELRSRLILAAQREGAEDEVRGILRELAAITASLLMQREHDERRKRDGTAEDDEATF